LKKRPLGCHIVIVLSLIALGILIHSNSSAEVIQIFPGPESGNIKALVIDPDFTTMVFTGTIGGGVFEGTDGGDTWTSLMLMDTDFCQPHYEGLKGIEDIVKRAAGLSLASACGIIKNHSGMIHVYSKKD